MELEKYCNSGPCMTNTLSNNDSLEHLAQELNAARMKKNLSVEDVSQLTKIKKHYLEQIENGNFSFLPKSYVYACIKAYMKEMGLEGCEALEQCKKDLEIHRPLQKEEIAETGYSDSEKNQRGDINIHKSQLVKSILPLTMGMLVGVLIGIGFSFRDHRVEVPVPRLPVITARPSVTPVDSSALKKQRIDSITKKQKGKSSDSLVTSSAKAKPSPPLIHSTVSDVNPAPQPVSDTEK
jgi:cytoskeleton protein RodZ